MSQAGFGCGCMPAADAGATTPCEKTSCINKQVMNIEVDIWDDPGCDGDNVVRVYNTDECVYKDGYFYWSKEDMNVDMPPSAKWSEPSTKCEMLKPSGLIAVPVTTTDLSRMALGDEYSQFSTSGFYAPNDSGNGTWVRTNVTGLTPSQLPYQTNMPALTDASGTRWVLQADGCCISARALGAVGDGIVDDTAVMNAAGASVYTVDISGMSVKITDMVEVHSLKGCSVTDSVLQVDSGFNMSARAVLSLQGDDGADITGGVGIYLDQPNVTSRSAVIKYPTAVTFNGLTRPRVDHLRVSGAWDGVDATGNTGGAKIGTMEIGALNEGLKVDGALDFWHADTLHFWPFGFVGSPDLLALYYDSTTIAARLGAIDGLDIKTLSSFRGRVLFETGVTRGPFGNIASLQTDGTSANIEFNDGHISVGSWYSTSAGDDVGLRMTGGELNIATHDITPFRFSTSLDAFVQVDGGILNMGTGYSRDALPEAPTYRVSGGEATFIAPTFEGGRNPTTPRTVGFVDQDGGRMTLIKPRLDDSGSGAGQVGISVSGGDWSTISVDSMLGWNYSIPDEFNTSVYSFPMTPNIATPHIEFEDGNGTFAPSYSAQRCGYTIIDNILHFNLLLRFDTNAFTGADGIMNIVSNIPHLPSDDNALTLGVFSNIDFDTDKQLAAEIEPTGNIRIRVLVPNGATDNIKASNILPSTSGVQIRVSGSYRAI